jgi:hypothetical protein
MRKKNTPSIVILSLLAWMLLSLPTMTIAKAQSQEVIVGVQVGDWVTYGDILVTWDSMDMEPDQELVELNSTLWFKHEVLDIDDTVIIFDKTTQFKNNTQTTSRSKLDIYTGEGNGTLMFISSGLGAYSMIYPTSVSLLWINQTTTRTYAGVVREVNYVNITQTGTRGGDPPIDIHVSISHYWDKETGVLTSRSGSGTYVDQNGNQIASWTRSDKVVETSLWGTQEKPDDQGETVDDFPYAIAGVVAVSLVLVGTWLFWRRKKRFKRRKTRMRR